MHKYRWSFRKPNNKDYEITVNFLPNLGPLYQIIVQLLQPIEIILQDFLWIARCCLLGFQDVKCIGQGSGGLRRVAARRKPTVTHLTKFNILEWKGWDRLSFTLSLALKDSVGPPHTQSRSTVLEVPSAAVQDRSYKSAKVSVSFAQCTLLGLLENHFGPASDNCYQEHMAWSMPMGILMQRILRQVTNYRPMSLQVYNVICYEFPLL